MKKLFSINFSYLLLVSTLVFMAALAQEDELIKNEDNMLSNSNQTAFNSSSHLPFTLNNTKLNKPDGLFVFKESLVKCPMYTKNCTFHVLIKSNVNIEKLILNTTNTKVFKNISIELCNNEVNNADSLVNATIKVCPQISDFVTRDLEEYAKEFSVYTITYIPELVGAAYLHFNITEDDNDSKLEEEEEISIDEIKKVDIFSSAEAKEVENDEEDVNNIAFLIVVVQPKRVIDLIFDIWVWTFGVLISMLMGILIDRNSLVQIIKMPIPVIIGFCCQYLFMPLLAFGFCILFKLTPVESLALFIYGCSPGGSASNNWTILFNGDIDLSAILTFVSTCGSLFMLPAWVYTLGTIFSKQAKITIPFFKLILNLIVTIGPCLIGIVISYFFPKVRPFFNKIAKPFTLFILLSFLLVVLIVKSYTFRLIEGHHWFAGPLIPWIGYLIGGFFAWVFRRPFKQVKTVAIETGIQNVGVAFLIVVTNFPSPDADFAVLPLIAVSFLTNIPLYIVYLIMKLVRFIKKCTKKNKPSLETEPSTTNEELKPEQVKMLPTTANV